MRVFRLALPLILAFGMAGCGSDEPVTMPDVTGQKLDVAYDKIQNAGFENKDDVKIEGGGTLGVIMEGNWTVCAQKPAAGEAIDGEPTLTVDRACDDGSQEDEASDRPSKDKSEDQSEEPKAAATPTPALPSLLTVQNTPDFKALLKLGDNCSDQVARFAKKYSGKKVRFDGSIGAMAPHGNYDTRFDILVGPGDFHPDKARGPNFQFRDKNVFDLNLTGEKIPEYVEVGQNYTFTAELLEYNSETCLYQLDPIETEAR